MPSNKVIKIVQGSGSFVPPAGVRLLTVLGVQNFAIEGLAAKGPGGSDYNGFLRYNGVPAMTGSSSDGQLGNNTSTPNVSSPVNVVGGNSFYIMRTAPAGSLALKPNGQLWTWGSNSSGQLGTNQNPGTTGAISSPVQIVVSGTFIAISCGQNSRYALKNDGTVWGWGNGADGRIGDGTAVSKSSPVQVIGGHSFVNIAALNSGGMGIKSDQTVWTWGEGTSGQLGDGTAVSKSSPVAVVGSHSFALINGSGGLAGYALKSDSTAWAWGGNTSGALGDGTTTNRSSPVAVVGGHSFIDVCGRLDGAIALKLDGTAWGWGQNANGQIGDGTTVSKSSPVQVIGGHSFVSIGGVEATSFGLKADGSVWAWGSNGTVGGTGVGVAGGSNSSPIAVIGPQNFSGGMAMSFLSELAVTPGLGITYNTATTGAGSLPQFGSVVSSVAVSAFAVIYEL